MREFLTYEFQKNRMLFIFAMGIMLSGIVAGLTLYPMASAMSSDASGISAEIFGNFLTPVDVGYAGGAEFTKALIFNASCLFCLWFAAFWLLGVVPIMMFLFYRGFVLGLSCSLLMASDAMHGMLILCLVVLPSQALLLVVFLVVAVVAAKISLSMCSEGYNLMRNFGIFCMLLVVAMAFIVLGAWLQTIATPYLLSCFIGV